MDNERKPIRVYIAGASWNVTALACIAEYVKRKGFEDSPCVDEEGCEDYSQRQPLYKPVCPWMNHLGMDTKNAFVMDLDAVQTSNIVLAVHPYGESGGTVTEMVWAMSKGIPVIYVAHPSIPDEDLPYCAGILPSVSAYEGIDSWKLYQSYYARHSNLLYAGVDAFFGFRVENVDTALALIHDFCRS